MAQKSILGKSFLANNCGCLTLDKTLNLTNEVILMLFYEGRVEKRTGIMGMPWGGCSAVTSKKNPSSQGTPLSGRLCLPS
jgi:hypothetical protein